MNQLLSDDEMNRVLVTIRDNNPDMAEPMARALDCFVDCPSARNLVITYADM